MQTIGVAIKPNDARARAVAGELIAWLHGKNCTVLHDTFVSDVGDATSLATMAERVDLMIVLGGDGTLLHVGRYFVGREIPILGINLGRLGFLTDTPVGSMFDVVARVLAGDFKSKCHFSLAVQTYRDERLIAEGIALNDVVMQRGMVPRMIAFEMYIREQFVFRLRADGLVLATPAGSTAYALSSGGPIVHPDMEAISVVPVCPHTLSNRPIVVPAADLIELRLTESDGNSLLHLDGQEHVDLVIGDRVMVQRGASISLVYLPERHYYEVLRTKLNWAGLVEHKNDRDHGA
ncbi:MAG: NAD(+)/NADH kinase [Zetaproteobacteria bacterium]|nr:NAD(+)/NADH kinase [Zetaproteobacteria bacterium]